MCCSPGCVAGVPWDRGPPHREVEPVLNDDGVNSHDQDEEEEHLQTSRYLPSAFFPVVAGHQITQASAGGLPGWCRPGNCVALLPHGIKSNAPTLCHLLKHSAALLYHLRRWTVADHASQSLRDSDRT